MANDINKALAADEAAETSRPECGTADPLPVVKRTRLADFRRDIEQKNTLIQGGWGKRGGISMHVSTTGSGKSVLQTQSALCFNRGVPCCGLRPIRPFKCWVIQSEDDDDRVAFDRDCIVEHLAADYPQEDWEAAARETIFLDFTGKTGAKFLQDLDWELKASERKNEKPEGIIINPMNAYFGGNLKDGADCSAFFKGGTLGRFDTEGLEAVLKRHNVWAWIFAHTPKPPTAKELDTWLNDDFPEYKMCGASEIADAVRSVITFLKVPGQDGAFAFTAGKNGKGLGWKAPDGSPTNRIYYRWSQDGGHYWEAVPEDERPTIGRASHKSVPPPPPPRDEMPVVRRVFASFDGIVTRGAAECAVMNAVNTERRAATPVVKDLGRNACHDLIDLANAQGVIKILQKGVRGAKGCMCGLPEKVDNYLNPPLIEAPANVPRVIVPGSPEADNAPAFGRSRKMNERVRL